MAGRLFFLGEELIHCRYSSCHSCWGDLILKKKPKAPSFLIWLGLHLAGLSFKY